MDLALTAGQSELKKRVITGVLGALVLLLLVLPGGRLGTAFVGAVIALAMIHEFSDMILTLPDRIEKRFVLMGTAWLVAFVSFWMPRQEYELLLLCFIGFFVYYLISAQRHAEGGLPTHFREFMASMFALFYLGFLPLFLVLVRDGPFGAVWTILFFLIVWGSDVGGYFAGLRYGKRKLYPLISPGKTVEGALGGLGLAIVATLIVKLVAFRELSWGGALITPIAVAAAAQLGDLCESFLKRAFDRKDSGNLLPGHGGVLDRFDGWLFGLPVMYACVRIFS